MSEQIIQANDKNKTVFWKSPGAFFTIYLFIGLIVAVVQSILWGWSPFSFFSPAFYLLIATWPLKIVPLVFELIKIFGSFLQNI